MESGEAKFGKYTILGRLGTGGMAEVFKGRLSGIGGFDKIVVIKRILPERLEDPEFVHMFLDEARIAANLNHPNIVQVYEVGEVDGAPYIAMEYVRGPTFSALMRAARQQQKVHFGHAVKILSGICAGLHYAHNAKDPNGAPLEIVHRDVSPQNILVSLDGLPKLLDFGVARAEGRLSRTQNGMFKGKLRYTAPEVLRGEPSDFRSDIYAVGICLFEATTGLQRFRNMSEPEMVAQAIKGEVPRPSAVVPDYPPELERIILWTLEPNPDDRCPTARQLHLALEQFASSSESHTSSQAAVARWVADLFPTSESDDYGRSYGKTPSIQSLSVSRSPPSKVTNAGQPDSAAASGGTGIQYAPGADAADAPVLASEQPTAVERTARKDAPASKEAPAPANRTTPPPTALPTPALEPGTGLFTAHTEPRRNGSLIAAIAVVVALVGGAAWYALSHADTKPPPPPVTQTEPPKPPPPSPDDTARAYLDEAERFATEHRYGPALELITKARDAHATDPNLVIRLMRASDKIERDALLAKAKLALGTNDAAGALTSARQVLERDPDNADAMRVFIQAREATEPADRGSSRKRQGTLDINSEPPALVYLDDAPFGLTPIHQRMPEGQHRVQVRLAGYQPQQRDVRIASGQTTTVRLELAPSGPHLGSADTATPPDAVPSPGDTAKPAPQR